jgi:hypothetical protein
MFPTGPDPRRSAPPPFSLDRKDILRAKQRRQLSRTEWRMVVFLPVLLGLLGWTMWDWKERLASTLVGKGEQLPVTAKLSPMARPGWDVLPAMPAQAEIDAAREAASALVDVNAGVPLTATGLDPITMAWAEARLEADRTTPPLPQRLAARDLLLADHVRLGTPMILEGLLEDRLPGRVDGSERPWQRLLLAIDEGQYVEVLSAARAAAEIPLGTQVRITGRLLAYDERPAGEATVQLPVILGRVLAVSTAQPEADDALAEFHRPFSMPSELFGEVDDFRLWTETRPYYYLLGQVLRDRTTAGAWDGAEDGNQAADDLHLNPANFRAKPYRVTGYVYESWEDQDVARDQPFGVGRVLRLLIYRRDVAPVTETIDGKENREVKQVLRLYELAVITDQPPPEKGTLVTAVGRFLKKRAIPVKVEEMRDKANGVQRHSDRIYTWLFVTAPWEVVPVYERYGMGALGWGLVILCSILLIVGIFWWRREVKDGGRLIRAKVVALRANRHRLAKVAHDAGGPAAPAAAAAEGPASPAAAPASSPAGPEAQAPPPP